MNTFDKSYIDIVENFDYEKVMKIMKILDWQYYNKEENCNFLPSLGTLVAESYRMLLEAWKIKGVVATGGFEAEYHIEEDEEWLTLKFILEEC